jgi:hypothetical protein
LVSGKQYPESSFIRKWFPRRLDISHFLGWKGGTPPTALALCVHSAVAVAVDQRQKRLIRRRSVHVLSHRLPDTHMFLLSFQLFEAKSPYRTWVVSGVANHVGIQLSIRPSFPISRPAHFILHRYMARPISEHSNRMLACPPQAFHAQQIRFAVPPFSTAMARCPTTINYTLGDGNCRIHAESSP